MNILVTGGAGYIGSFMVSRLLEKGENVYVVDSLERGDIKAIDKKAHFIQGNLLDKDFIARIFSNNKFDAVVHFAGYISMAESMREPYSYFQNNTLASLNIAQGMVASKINNLIFSSTAGIYGNPINNPIPEDHPKNPTNPYGESKLIVEKILSWYQAIHSLNFIALRYFNAAGASLDGNMGENHNPETHIIPNAIKAAINNTEFTLYGDDYSSPDGTCIRDYIHVIDLVDAHILAISKLQKNNGGFFYNVGTGKGYSNKEVINVVKKVTGVDLKVKIAPRRPGDAEVLIADPTNIKKDLDFKLQYSDLEVIVRSAWDWHQKSSK